MRELAWRHYLKLLVLCLCYWSAHAAATEAPPHNHERSVATLSMTEEQALALFFERNLGIIAAQYNIDMGQAELLLASALPNPKVGFEFYELNPDLADNGQDPNKKWPLGSSPAWSARIEQLIVTAGKLRLRTEAAEIGNEALQYDLLDVVRVLSNALRHSFYDLLLAQKNAALAAENLSRYQEILRINQARLNVGDIAATEYARIEVESLKTQAEVDSTQTAVQQARAALLLLLGWPDNHQQIIVADAWPSPHGAMVELAPDALVGAALNNRPDLLASRLRVERAERNAELARRLIIPDVTMVAYFLRDPGNFYTNTGGVGFNMELPLFNQHAGDVARSGVELNNARLFIRQNEQNIRADIMKSHAAWMSAHTITLRFEQSVISRIEQLRQSEEYAYQRGRASLLQLIDAERNYKAMMQDYYVALTNRSKAWADLRMATGEQINALAP